MVSLGAVVGLATAACDGLGSLLDVDAPSRIPAEDLEDPANADLLVRGAVADFECALTNYILAGGLLGEELADAQTAGVYWDYDRRTVTADRGPHTSVSCDDGWGGVYVPLSVARFAADDALRHLDGWTDEEVTDRTGLIATAAAFSGYSHVLLGEGMCSAAVDQGPELSRQELNALAEEKFGRAIEAASVTGADDILALARVGRARARLNQGDLAGAESDARQVPEGFRYDATYSATNERRYNTVFDRNLRFASVTVEQDYRNLEFGGVPDSRVQVTDSGELGNDRVTPLWVQTKYETLETPITMATWEEARLIIAEAVGGPEAVDIINDLHSRVGLPPFTGGDAEAIRQQIIDERARELFLEGHHLGDLNRYAVPLTPPAGTPYPPKAGGTYGDQTCFPLPERERQNNPNIP